MHRRQNGSTDEALAQLIQLKARKFIRHPALRKWTIQDLVQEMRLIWLLRGHQFNLSRGDLLTFADFVFNNHLRNLIAYEEADMRDHRLCTESLDDPVTDPDGDGLTRHEVYSPESYFNATGGRHPGQGQILDMRVDLATAMDRLPARKRELAARLATQSVAEAAKAMGISRETATVWRRQIRDAFTKAGLNAYLPESSKKPHRTT